MRPKILVIGATGKHGNTGAIVVDRLISHGRDVRVLTRTDDRRIDALRQRGFAWLPNSHRAPVRLVGGQVSGADLAAG